MPTYKEVLRILEQRIEEEMPRTGPRSLIVEQTLMRAWNTLRRQLALPTCEMTQPSFYSAKKKPVSAEDAYGQIPAYTIRTIQSKLKSIGIAIDTNLQ